MKNYILGTDPGRRGAFALLSTTFNPGLIEADDLILYPFKSHKNSGLDVRDMYNFISPYKNQIRAAYLELVHSLGHTAAAATFTFGFNTGVVYGIMQLLNVPVFRVAPAVWQKHTWKPEHILMINDTDKKDTKATSLNAAHSIFPNVSFIMPRGRVPHDGCVDAALIAYYGLSEIVNH